MEVQEYLDGSWLVTVWLPHSRDLLSVLEASIGGLWFALASASSAPDSESPAAASARMGSRRRRASDAGHSDAA